MKLGLVGAGRIGAVHAATLGEHPLVDALVIADQEPDRSQRMADDVGAVAVSPADVFDGVDGIVIASPTDTHVDYLMKAARHGIPTFCEKPIAIDLAATDRAIDAIEQAGIAVQIGFMRRFDPGYVEAHRLVADGKLGTVIMVTGHTHDPAPPSPEYVARSGGVFKDMLIHDIDALRFVTGREIVEVQAAGSNVTMEDFSRFDDLATVGVLARLDDGALAVLSGTRRDPLGYDVRMEVFGTADSVAVGLDAHTPIRSLEPGAPASGAHPRSWDHRFAAAFRAELHAFVEVAAGERPSPCPPIEARRALLVAEACGRAARERRPVTVEDGA